MSTEKSIPVIDISPYLDAASPPEAKTQVINEVKQACSQYGFLQIKGHGIPLSLQRQILECCKTFFDLPLEQKEALSLKNSQSRHGYERLREQTLDQRALPDEKEGFYIGRDEHEEKGFRRGPNQWPPQLAPTQFREPVLAYYGHARRLAQALVEMLALGLGHPVHVLDAFTREPVMNLKLLHYPPAPAPAVARDAAAATAAVEERQRFGAAEHTDFGAITVLLQQPRKDGLQVRDDGQAGRWIAVPAVEDVLVVNMGDLVQKWTGGRYRSTVHRVINAGGGDRYSVPCFYEGDYRATNPFCPDEIGGETVEEHIRRRFDGSYGLSGKV